MRRITLLKMAVAVGAALFLSTGPAAAQDANMETAMNAVFGKTGEMKKLKIRGHEFNVKPAAITANGGKVTIKGQLSHHWRFRDDDQVYYTIEKENGKLVKIDVKVEGSTLQKVFGQLKEELKEWLKDEAVKQIVGEGSKPGGGTTARLRPQEEKETLEKALAKVETLAEKGWEGAAKVIIANVAIRADNQGGDRLVQLRKMVGPGRTPTKPRK